MKTALTLLALAAVLAASAVLLHEGLSIGDGPVDMGTHGVLALAIGMGGTILVGCGLMFLLFYSHRRGYDDAADEWYRRHGGEDRRRMKDGVTEE
jgi:hypothetical protein